MSRIAYVNGRFTRHAQACVHIEDRGYQFADGVYEVWAVFGGRLADSQGHFERLARSLSELRIAMPLSRAALEIILRETIRRNHVRDGMVYLQVTRGVAPRDHPFPAGAIRPSLVVTAKSVDMAKSHARAGDGGEGYHGAGDSLGAMRHQDHRPSAQCSGQTGRAGSRRHGGLVRG